MDTIVKVEELARGFLQESVYASRQASHSFSPRSLDGASSGSHPAEKGMGCGLGLRPAIPDDFSPKQADLLSQILELIGAAPEEPTFASMRAAAAEWIKIQDAVDRQRNHYLRDFRQAHGFDRKAYPAPVEEDFKRGLEAINEDNRRRLERHARELASRLTA